MSPPSRLLAAYDVIRGIGGNPCVGDSAIRERPWRTQVRGRSVRRQVVLSRTHANAGLSGMGRSRRHWLQTTRLNEAWCRPTLEAWSNRLPEVLRRPLAVPRRPLAPRPCRLSPSSRSMTTPRRDGASYGVSFCGDGRRVSPLTLPSARSTAFLRPSSRGLPRRRVPCSRVACRSTCRRPPAGTSRSFRLEADSSSFVRKPMSRRPAATRRSQRRARSFQMP
jgi:hypothetical protein